MCDDRNRRQHLQQIFKEPALVPSREYSGSCSATLTSNAITLDALRFRAAGYVRPRHGTEATSVDHAAIF